MNVNIDVDAVQARLDAELASAEAAVLTADQRLAQARARVKDAETKRTGFLAVLAYVTEVGASSPAPEAEERPALMTSVSSFGGPGAGPKDIITSLLRERPNQVLTNAQVQEIAGAQGFAFTSEQVRNALSYLGRLNVIQKGERRASWIYVPGMIATRDESSGAADGDDPAEAGSSTEASSPSAAEVKAG